MATDVIIKYNKVGYAKEEPMEVHFHSVTYKGETVRWQLVASVNASGMVGYTLHRIPRSAWSDSLTNLVGNTTHILPLKAYEGWQWNVLQYLTTLTLSNEPVYNIDEVL